MVSHARQYLEFDKNKKDLEKIIDDSNTDKEIREMAEIEFEELIKRNELNIKK